MHASYDRGPRGRRDLISACEPRLSARAWGRVRAFSIIIIIITVIITIII